MKLYLYFFENFKKKIAKATGQLLILLFLALSSEHSKWYCFRTLVTRAFWLKEWSVPIYG